MNLTTAYQNHAIELITVRSQATHQALVTIFAKDNETIQAQFLSHSVATKEAAIIAGIKVAQRRIRQFSS